MRKILVLLTLTAACYDPGYVPPADGGTAACTQEEMQTACGLLKCQEKKQDFENCQCVCAE